MLNEPDQQKNKPEASKNITLSQENLVGERVEKIKMQSKITKRLKSMYAEMLNAVPSQQPPSVPPDNACQNIEKQQVPPDNACQNIEKQQVLPGEISSEEGQNEQVPRIASPFRKTQTRLKLPVSSKSTDHLPTQSCEQKPLQTSHVYCDDVVDILEAVASGFYNNIPSQPEETISWQSMLCQKIIAEGKVISIREKENAPEEIWIKRLAEKGQFDEIYEVSYGPSPNAHCVLKIPLLPLATNQALFELELKNLLKLQHIHDPHLPKIKADYLYLEGLRLPYYITYLVQPMAKSFNFSSERPLHPMLAIFFFYGLMKSIENLANAQLVHGNIKPDHVMFYDFIPVLVNFHTCKSQEDIAKLDMGIWRENLHGTPEYLAPELIEVQQDHILFHKKLLSSKTDIWALGLMLMEWLTGKSLFQGISLGNNKIEILLNVHRNLQQNAVLLYKKQCQWMLARRYQGQGALSTDQQDPDSSHPEFITRKVKLNEYYEVRDVERVGLENVEAKDNLVSNIMRVFGLCILPLEKRPAAGEILQTLDALFPWLRERWEYIFNARQLPHL